jgi:hypothetical protein
MVKTDEVCFYAIKEEKIESFGTLNIKKKNIDNIYSASLISPNVGCSAGRRI